jgi:hypothetical protein
MPRIVGGFQRINGEFVGQVWNQDLETDTKIIASRHDTHDQDLADGIYLSLPRDGSDPMTGDLDMNGFRIINLAQGTNSDDVARLSDTISGVLWDNTPGELVFQKDNVDWLRVGLPIGGGAGTVQQIDIGQGLGSTQIPLTTIGELSLLTQAGVTPGTYTSADVTVNNMGVITGIQNGTGGGGGDSIVNMSAAQTASNFQVLATNGLGTGAPAALQAASSIQMGVVTPTQHDRWENKDLQATYLTGPSAKVTISHVGLTAVDADIDLWANTGINQQIGVFAGEMTLAAPAEGVDQVTHGKPVGYVWFEVGSLT